MKIAFGDIEVSLSSTDRLVFPDAGVTKGDVIDYYRDLAALILPELERRPLTLERFNKGITGPGYFQKHIPKYFPKWIDRVTVPGKTEVTHAVCTKPADLVYLANQNTLTFHVPTCRVDQLGHPDRLIFDLDPPPGRFDLVIAAAGSVRALCEELELAGYCKTTGSKGLHVVVPLDGSADYGQVHRFAANCSELLASRHPDRFTTEFYKKDRGGRLYLDADRNHAGATAVAPYAVRARPGAPIAAPLAWNEVGGDLRSDAIGLREIRERVDRVGDPWAELADRAAPLGPAIDRLAELTG